MARDFEDHCWKDVIDARALEIYQRYEREIRIGEKPALLAVDLYNLVYAGGPRPVHEIFREHGSTCGEYAWAAIAPTQRLFQAARNAGIPIIYSTDDLDGALFTFAEACEYLERSQPQVRRYVADQAIVPTKSIGKNQMFDLSALRSFKKTLRLKPANGTKRLIVKSTATRSRL